MKRIKFRAYIKSLKWLVLVERICFDCETVEVDLTAGNGDTAEYNFDEIVLMQYTGIEDKNGQSIYEGDILHAVDRIVKVHWHEHCGCWDSDFVRYQGELMSNGISAAEWCRRAIVIGNIYENPELLDAC